MVNVQADNPHGNDFGAAALPPELARHAERRQQRLPTIAVFVGASGTALQMWRRFTDDHAIFLHSPSLRSIAVAWLGRVAEVCDVSGRLASLLGQRLGVPDSEALASLRQRTAHQGQQLIEHAFAPESPPSVGWLARLLLPELMGDPSTEAWLPVALSHCDSSDPVAIVASFSRLLPEKELPAITILPAETAGQHGWLEKAIGVLERLASAAPALRLAVVCSEAELGALSRAPSSTTRAQSLAAEGLIRVRGLAGKDVLDRIGRLSPAVQLAAQPAIEDLRLHGGSEDSVNLLIEAANSIQAVNESAEYRDRARSAAERFLFDRLESRSSTAGLFRLNEKVRTSKDSGLLEIDLSTPNLRIAIEIDGYFHFKDIDVYRRDRRKDFLLQEAGYFVLRCMADEVVSSLEEIFRRVHRAIAVQSRRDRLTEATLI